MNAAEFFRLATALHEAYRTGDRAGIKAAADRVRRDGRPDLADRIEAELLPDTTKTSH